jgi:hypothetical protein
VTAAYPLLAALLLVSMANAAPWVSGRLLGERWNRPLDGADGVPLRVNTLSTPRKVH